MAAVSRRTVGRDPELQRIDGLVAPLAAGMGAVCVVEGEPGIGKSQLVDELRARAADVGIDTLIGHGEPLERGRPLHVFDRLFDLGDLVDDDPAATGSGLEPMLSGRHRVRELMVAALEHEALEPIVLVAEDVHWADEASLLVLIDAIRLSESLPIVVMLTCRQHPRSTGLARVLDLVRRRADHEWFELRPLDSHDVRTLAESEAASLTLTDNGGALEAAGGNPFLVLELVRAWSTRGDAHSSTVPLDRISHLHDLGVDVHECMRAAAILGIHFDLTTLTALLEMPLDELGPVLESASRASIVRLTDGGAEFRHDLIREALYLEIPAELRATHHRRAAASMLDRGASPVEAAEHLLLGSVEGDQSAVEALEEAALRLVTIDPERSLELLNRVDEIDAGRPLGEQARRLETRIRALAAVGRLDEAIEIGSGVAAMGADSAGRAELAEVLAGVAFLANRPHVGLEELAKATDSAIDPIRRVRLDAQGSLMLMACGDVAGGIAAARAAAGVASELGDPIARSLALSVEGRLATFDHHYDQGRDLGLEAVSAADLDPTGESHRWLPWLFLGLTELDLDHLESVEKAILHGQEAARRAKTPWAEPLYTALAASAALRSGDLDDALSLAEGAVELSRSFESTQALAWAHATAGLSALAAGDPSTAETESDAARVAGESGSMLGADHVVRLTALLAEERGDLEAAFEELHGAWQLFEAAEVLSCQPVLAPDLTRLAMATGRGDVAASVADTMATATERSVPTWIDACALRCEGLATRQPGPLRRAGEIYRQGVRRLDLAASLAELGTVVAPAERQATVDEAIGLYEQCGATGRVTRLRAASPTTSWSPAKSDWDRLTKTELAIVELTCEGLTNSETAERRGISRRTVESHLARAFRKLDVRTRSQLVVLAMQRDGEHTT